MDQHRGWCQQGALVKAQSGRIRPKKNEIWKVFSLKSLQGQIRPHNHLCNLRGEGGVDARNLARGFCFSLI